MPRPEKPLIVSLDAESRIFVDKDEISQNDRLSAFKQLALDSESGEVYVRGDGEVKYARMMELMSELGQAGFARVTLVTSVQGGSKKEALDNPASPAQAGPGSAQGQAPEAQGSVGGETSAFAPPAAAAASAASVGSAGPAPSSLSPASSQTRPSLAQSQAPEAQVSEGREPSAPASPAPAASAASVGSAGPAPMSPSPAIQTNPAAAPPAAEAP
jgi:hypothetical protein